ncbi:uncharacterized protein MELLADRAFT_112145 [Melampsora larici-populina 98AG31]|uniref:Uncharacterized protein n=1 Tax=Melampsora larici-populina (strain 98AG31 / pathotype 3-4-7) TaxID=747676 RepID=F4S5J0_MELLP|nr:uncharacterized protein MELLADRAFT_112145 [Melampsora larici-populina 98AG31]EGG00097.1 hypothetical protein MELLADRAFT_112145 [Melampsora larici-populina 98AG31]
MENLKPLLQSGTIRDLQSYMLEHFPYVVLRDDLKLADLKTLAKKWNKIGDASMPWHVVKHGHQGGELFTEPDFKFYQIIMSSVASETPSRSRPVRHRQPAIHPGMVSPAVDSRRRLSVDDQSQPALNKTKRKDRSYDPKPENESDSSIVSIQCQGRKKDPKATGYQSEASITEHQGKKSKKGTGSQSKSQRRSQARKKTASAAPSDDLISANVTRAMLRADSDEEPSGDQPCKRHKADEADAKVELAQLRAYYDTPFHRHDDEINPPVEEDDAGNIDIEDKTQWDIADAEDEVTPAVVLEEEVAPTHR